MCEHGNRSWSALTLRSRRGRRAGLIVGKQAVNAWASADNGDKALRFAAAETVRWLDWAVRSYQSFVFGLALILFGAVIVVTGRVSRPIGYLMALCGLCYLAQGWIIGSSGFSSANQIPTLLGIGSILVWTVWLLIVALRMKTAAHTETTSHVKI
jgi:hypothetical protein